MARYQSGKLQSAILGARRFLRRSIFHDDGLDGVVYQHGWLVAAVRVVAPSPDNGLANLDVARREPTKRNPDVGIRRAPWLRRVTGVYPIEASAQAQRGFQLTGIFGHDPPGDTAIREV